MKNLFVSIFFTWSLFKVDAQLPNYVPTQDLAGWYSFNGNILDYSGNGNNNASYNIVSTTDRFNNIMGALYFSGSSSEYLNYGDVNDYEPYQGSFSFWINPDNYGGSTSELFKPIVSKWAAPSDISGSSYIIFLNGTDLCFLLSDASSTDTLTAPSANIPLNQWSHVVITANYGFIKIFINNVLITDTVSPISSFNNTSCDFKVGGWQQSINSSFSSFTGKIDDLGIWSREISSCEVDALYTENICATATIQGLDKNSSELVQITDLMGRMADFQPNTVQLYYFSDGTIVRKCIHQ
jgi:hypothetical protein